MSFLEWVGIICLILAATVTVCVLLYDLLLFITGQQTISRGVWTQLKAWRAGQASFPWRAVWLPVLMLFGPVGLAIHFFF